jgi:hypothetical protein
MTFDDILMVRDEGHAFDVVNVAVAGDELALAQVKVQPACKQGDHIGRIFAMCLSEAFCVKYEWT